MAPDRLGVVSRVMSGSFFVVVDFDDMFQLLKFMIVLSKFSEWVRKHSEFFYF